MIDPRPGKLVGIARKEAHRAPMELLEHGLITRERGLEGDYLGAKSEKRQVTILTREDWDAALADLARSGRSTESLDWTARRANLLIEGIALPHTRGGLVRIGPALLEITGPTNPCERMDEVFEGLEEALRPDWRGGVCCRVLEGGVIVLGDLVMAGVTPPEQPVAGS